MTRRSFDILHIPEIVGLDAKTSLIRIPPELDVPLTARVRKIIDTPEFRRLAEISQLGLVSLVYPGARHTRFEHSLGVYRLALLFLRRLANDDRFAALVQENEAPILIAAALLHDIGHWPNCHLVEDIDLPGVPHHEAIARRFITRGEIADILRTDWGITPDDVVCLLEKSEVRPRPEETEEEFQRRRKVFHLFMTILSGPIDIDKMDYLFRDSHGCGVPYGRHFDQERLIGSLCLNETEDGLAISDKGKTAAELMVFARYVMFSEVYWHHTVRSATAMFQRGFEILFDQYPGRWSLIESALTDSPEKWRDRISGFFRKRIENLTLPEESRRESADALALFDGIFGNRRNIYKRIRQFSLMEHPEIYRRLAGKGYQPLRVFTRRLVESINRQWADSAEPSVSSLPPLGPNDLLVDSPPVAKEVEFKIDVYYQNKGEYHPLRNVSPVVRALAAEQFDHHVKKVRIFAHPDRTAAIRQIPNLDALIEEASAFLAEPVAWEEN